MEYDFSWTIPNDILQSWFILTPPIVDTIKPTTLLNLLSKKDTKSVTYGSAYAQGSVMNKMNKGHQ